MGAGRGATRRAITSLAEWYEIDISELCLQNEVLPPLLSRAGMAEHYERLREHMEEVIRPGMRLGLNDSRYWKKGVRPPGGLITGIVEKIEGDGLISVKWDDEDDDDSPGFAGLVGLKDDIKIYSSKPPAHLQPVEVSKIDF